MTSMDDDTAGTDARRRRRRRPGDTTAAAQPERAEPQPESRPAERKPRRPRSASDGAERGLRDIVGAGRSQVGVDGALRARDVNRPTDEDLAEAAAALVVVRRNWQPPDGRK